MATIQFKIQSLNYNPFEAGRERVLEKQNRMNLSIHAFLGQTGDFVMAQPFRLAVLWVFQLAIR